ncbi:MAG: thermonuclease family protein [Acidobacteriota bacterium]|nr:thermonuclease family protein [Blastocatellia bacterium]MDW8412910.1 thermonuclease family protein [Acidobacteriota bacterium]
MRKLVIMLVLLTLDVYSQQKYRVIKVLSGDLMVLEDGQKLRLMGADAPVMAQGKRLGQEPWASAAKATLEELVLDKEVIVDSLGLKLDEYGRRIGLVYVGGLWIDREMVARGQAVVQNNQYLERKHKVELMAAQSEARRQGLGIWDPFNLLPMPPREFRAAHKMSEGDDSKVDAWKYAVKPSEKPSEQKEVKDLIVRQQPKPKGGVEPRLAQIQRAMDLNTPPPTGKAAGIEQASLMYETLKQIKQKVDTGIGMAELEALTHHAEAQYRGIADLGIDKALMGDFNDAIEGYKLAIAAYKKSKEATGENAERYRKLMNDALDLSDRAIELARRRVEFLKKPRDWADR